MNKIRTFWGQNPKSLEREINDYCEEFGYNPISISVTMDELKFYTAFVVMSFTK